MKSYCPHWPGREYEKDTGKTTCLMTIDGVKEAYELSFVAVPAQPRAGATKNYGPKPEEKPKTGPENEEKHTQDSELNLRVKALESFIFTHKQEEIVNE